MYLYCHLSPAPCMTGTPRWAKRPAEPRRRVYPRIGDPLPSSLWSRIKEALRQTACQSLCWINCGILEDCVSRSLKLFSLVGEANSLNDFFSQWLRAPSTTTPTTPPPPHHFFSLKKEGTTDFQPSCHRSHCYSSLQADRAFGSDGAIKVHTPLCVISNLLLRRNGSK